MDQNIKTYRKEIKYIIPYDKALKIREDISATCQEDSHNGDSGYRIRSLYFDSLYNHDYYTKVNGTQVRKKIRLRTYGDSQVYKLELKQKSSDNQLKESLIVSEEDARLLASGDYEVLQSYFDKDIAVRLYSLLTAGLYKPVVLIDYERQAYIHDLYDTRITIDSAVKASEVDFDIENQDILMNPILEDRCILEIKYSGKLLGFISDLLSKYNLNQESYSKYVSGRMIYI